MNRRNHRTITSLTHHQLECKVGVGHVIRALGAADKLAASGDIKPLQAYTLARRCPLDQSSHRYAGPFELSHLPVWSSLFSTFRRWPSTVVIHCCRPNTQEPRNSRLAICIHIGHPVAPSPFVYRLITPMQLGSRLFSLEELSFTSAGSGWPSHVMMSWLQVTKLLSKLERLRCLTYQKLQSDIHLPERLGRSDVKSHAFDGDGWWRIGETWNRIPK